MVATHGPRCPLRRLAAIVEAQAPECYSLSRIYLCGREPPTPELSVQQFYPPDMELNADILGIGRKEIRKPRMPRIPLEATQ